MGTLVECEILRGLKPFALREVSQILGRDAVPLPLTDDEALAFRFRGTLDRLLDLRTVVAAYVVLNFEIPRPLALLGDQHFRALLAGIATVRGLHPTDSFRTLLFSAAGRDSPAITRLRKALGEATGLSDDSAAGDLQLRLRRSALPHGESPPGWEVLVRLTPRPLATRPWRTFNLPGAVNATIAAAIADLGSIRSSDRYLNLVCGSGTILIERLLRGPARSAIGVDLDPLALSHAEEHLRAAGLSGLARVLEMDATCLAFPNASFDSLAADLPWGQLTGSHRKNTMLYPRVLAEAYRVAAPGARLVLLTHEVVLLERLLPDFADRWQLREVVRIYQGGLHPRIYLLDRVG